LAIRYRLGQGLVLLVLAALITACAVLAPLYDRAMQQALTRLTVDGASSSATAIEVRSVSRFTFGLAGSGYVPATQDRLASLLPAEARPWFDRRIDGGSLLVTRSDQTSASPVGALQWRDGACEHVDLLAGGCPTGRGEVAVSAADVTNYRLGVGSRVDVVEQTAVDQDGKLPVVPLRVTGVYRQVRGPYWNDQLLTGLSGFIGTQPPYRPMHDTWLTTAATFSGVRWLDPTTSVTFDLDRPAAGVDRVVRAGAIATRMADVGRPQVDDLGGPLNGADAVLAEVQSGLPGISGTIDRGRRQALVTVPLLMIQLGLLALFVLGLTLGAAVEQRRPEVAVARLRGAGRVGARRLVLAELLPVVLAGVPVGVAVALGLATVARHTVLQSAAPFELGRGFWLAIAVAAVLLAAVTWAAAAAGTRDRIAQLLRSVPMRAPGWRLGVTDAVLIAASGTAVLLFVTGDLRGPLALAAPALLALIAGLLLAHLIVPVATWAGRRLTARGAYAAALALLAIARRPATRRVVTVVTVASALLVFSTYAVSVGARNRQLAAQRDTGAPMVAELTGTDVARVRTALATVADGHATPVVRVAPNDKAFRTTLAVEPDAFRRIALFPGADPAAVPWSSLRVPTGRRLGLTGRTLSFLATPSGFDVDGGAPAALRLEFLDPAGDQKAVEFGPLPTTGPRTLSAAVPCATGCTVIGLAISVDYGTRHHGQLGISEVRAGGGSTDLPGTAADWQPGVDQLDRISAAGPGLSLRVDSDGRSTPLLASRWFPAALPALVVDAGGADTVLGSGFTGSNRTMAAVSELPRAPGLAGPAAVVDLDLLQHWGSRAGKATRIQVWFDTEDPAALARVRGALDRAGIEISGVRRLSEVRAGYAASVPAWSLQLGILAAVAGLLLAALVLVLLVASTWRRRSRDLACLGMSGVPRRGLGRVAVGEQLPVVLLAVLAGGGCGLLGAVFALPTVPLFAQPRPAAELDLAAPVGAVLLALAAALVVLGLVAWLCGRAVARAGSRLARVREAL
jgi:hypothetical protein